jgi:hypothetical protein
MYQRTKRRIITILAAVFLATLALFCLTLMPNTHSAKAEIAAPQNLKVDTLGFLRWDEVAGAEDYEWSYSTDGTNYSTAEVCDGTEADVSAAITEAIKLARENSQTSATLNLKVKATGGAETAFTYTFDKYINYGYSTHDIADVYAPAVNGKTGTFQAHSALYVNELVTFGLSFSQARNVSANVKPYYFVGFMNDGNTSFSQYFYIFSFEPHGWTKLYKQYATSSPLLNQDIGADMTVGKESYFAVGVFDTYKVSDGSAVGETVYLRRTDIVNGESVVIYAGGIFVDSTAANDRPTHLPNARNHTAVNNSTADGTDGKTGTVPKDTFAGLSTNDTGAKITSGKIPTNSEGVATPSMVYYDNVDGQVKWNKVEDATNYV